MFEYYVDIAIKRCLSAYLEAFMRISDLLSFDDDEWGLTNCNILKQNLQISVGRDILSEKISPTLPLR